VIKKSSEVPLEFHAQFSAKAKAYRYQIIYSRTRPVLERRYAHWIKDELDIEKMRQAAQFLVGTHDFSSFEAANSPKTSQVRTVNYIDIAEENCYIRIKIEADGFLYRMVRNIVGTLILIGWNQKKVEDMSTILNAKNRKLAGPTIPAKGLFLEYVVY
jgi:tRNA pseudouridine38-40 synthase